MQTTDDAAVTVGGRPLRRLLAVNLNFLGDGLFTTPALALLRARYPGTHIEVLAGERAAAVLADDPGVDTLLVRPRREGAARAGAFARMLRAGNYDAVVLFQSIGANAALSWMSGVPIRVGFTQDGCTPFLTHRVAGRRPGEHVVDAYLRLADALRPDADTGGGLSATPDPALAIHLTPEDAAFAERVFRGQELLPPVVGLVIGATRPQKRWPEEYWARLAEKLWAAGSVSCVLLGGAEETAAAERILSQTRRDIPLWSLVGQTTEKQLAALIARLELVVSGDTGPLHIATAVRTPVVALFGSTDPADTGPWRGGAGCGPATVLYDALSCAPCRKSPTCGGRFDCLRALTPERVLDASCDLLGLSARRSVLPVLSSGTHTAAPAPADPSREPAGVGADAPPLGEPNLRGGGDR